LTRCWHRFLALQGRIDGRPGRRAAGHLGGDWGDRRHARGWEYLRRDAAARAQPRL